MSEIKSKYAAAAAMTITLASLSNNSARQSSEVDNSTNRYLDVLVTIKLKTGGSGVAAAGGVTLFAFGSINGGTTRTENAGGSDAAITLTNPPNARMIGFVNAVANATSYVAGPFSVAAAFGGVLPQRWGIIVYNESGAALSSTGGDFDLSYQGVTSELA